MKQVIFKCLVVIRGRIWINLDKQALKCNAMMYWFVPRIQLQHVILVLLFGFGIGGTSLDFTDCGKFYIKSNCQVIFRVILLKCSPISCTGKMINGLNEYN